MFRLEFNSLSEASLGDPFLLVGPRFKLRWNLFATSATPFCNEKSKAYGFMGEYNLKTET